MAKLPQNNEVSASLLDAAKTGAEGVRTLTGEALGAAAAAAAGVVLQSVSKALGKGEATVSDSTLAVTETVKDKVTSAIVKKSPERRAAKRSAVVKKRSAPKAKRRAAKKASPKKKKSARPQAKQKAKAKKAKSSTKRKAKKSRR